MAEHSYRTYKEQSVDENPYICYAPEDDTSISDVSGGGGGGDTNVFIVHGIKTDSNQMEIEESFSAIENAYNSGRYIILKLVYDEYKTIYIPCIRADYEFDERDHEYRLAIIEFESITFNEIISSPVSVNVFRAKIDNASPIYYAYDKTINIQYTN